MVAGIAREEVTIKVDMVVVAVVTSPPLLS